MHQDELIIRCTSLGGALLLAFGSGAMLLAIAPAYAQDAAKEPTVLQRVEVTGSSIKRIAAEGALPVTVLKAEDIRAAGVTSAVDLVRKLTSVQGATSESTSVGFDTKGFAGLSIHNLGESRTLVLLNGRRLAQFGGQDLTGAGAGFDLNAIPLAAIERVELLTDGASALYGADAIGGVVNFITKRNITEGEVGTGFSFPAKGAREQRLSATKGFGSLDDDGYNVMLSFGHDERTALKSSARSFAKTGNVGFGFQGKQYLQQRISASAIPATIENQNSFEWTSPFLATNGVCPPKTFRVTFPSVGTFPGDDYCGFDVIGELEIYPERKRDNFMASATARVGNHELFADVLFSRTQQVARLAPATGNIFIPAGSALHNLRLNVAPLNIVDDVVAFYRLADLGKRTNSDTSEFTNLVLGSRGEMFGWDYNAGLTHSVSNVKSTISGYPGTLAVQNLANSGLLDPFVGPGQQSAAAQAAIAATNYNGYWNGGVAKLDSVGWNGTRALTDLPGGPLMLGAGVNINREGFQSKPSLFAQAKLADPVTGVLCDPTAAVPIPCDQRFGDTSEALPYSASRTSQGVFGELVIPLAKALELGTALRADHYSDFGSATTGKGSFRWTPATNLLVRGSIGNGFRAPTVPQVKAAVQSFGVTGGNYACTPGLLAVATALGAVCQTGTSAYDLLAGGNPRLQPEKSKQASLGMRLDPTDNLSLGADLWHVQIANRIGQLTEQAVFANPLAFPSAWGTKKDLAGTTFLAFLQNNENLGKSYTTGMDFDFSGKTTTAFGLLSSQLTLTYVLREVSQLEKGGRYFSAVGNFADLGTVTFRTQGRLATSLKSGAWTNTVAVNFKSGYKDQETEVNLLDATGAITGSEKIRIHAGSYATLDWQTAWNPNKQWTFNAGVLNLFDRAPPFVVSVSGTNRGQQFGYDDRYYDARGRTVYVNASYKF